MDNFSKDISNYNSRENLCDERDEDIYVVVGGDGTLNYFLNNELPDSKTESTSVIYFPMGTANDFARAFSLKDYSPKLERVIDAIKSQYFVKVPVMKCNEQFFINAASIGMPANISEDQDNAIKKIAGPISYHISAISELFTHEKAQTVKVNGEAYKSLGMIISQGLYAGGGAKINPHFNPQFGKTFSLVLHTGENIGPSINAFFSMQTNDFKDMPSEVVTKDYEELNISYETKQIIKLDGEVYEASDFKFKKSDKSLRFFTLH